jgi:hypothetical protein
MANFSLCTLHGRGETSLKQRLFWRDAKTNTRDGCAPQTEIRLSGFGVERLLAIYRRWTFSGAGQVTAYALYRSRFLCRCALMRLRRLCLAIFAFRLFFSDPIQIFKFANGDSTI